MALVVKDRVRETSTTSGTGTLTLGGAVSGFQTFAAIGDGNTTYYAIVDAATGAWEVGIGVYTASGTTLSRNTVLESSNSGNLVNFSANVKDVFCTYAAEKAVYLDTDDDVNLPEDLNFTAAGARIRGDFSNATLANRVMFQTSTANSLTSIGVIPNGTSAQSQIVLESDSAVTNGSIAQFINVGGSDVRIVSGIRGTGTYLPMTFHTGGSERMRIDTSGNINIPTLGARITGDFSNATVANRVMFQSSTVNGVTAISALPNGTSTAAVFRAYGTSDPANSANTVVGIDSTRSYIESQITGTGTYLPMTFGTGGSERMRVTTAGDVGIGTSVPGYKLQVNEGNAAVVKSSGIPLFLVESSQASGYNPPQMQLIRKGVGGVATPDNSVIGEIRFDGLSTGNVYDNMAYIQVQSGVNASGGAPSFMVFATASSGANATERMRITSAGDVGIGGTPFSKLDVHGTFTSRGGTEFYTASVNQIWSGNVYGAYNQNNGTVQLALACNSNLAELRAITNHPLLIYTNNAERMRIDANGRVLMGFTTSKVYGGKLQVQNTIESIGADATSQPYVVAYDHNALDSTPTYSSAVLRKFGPSSVGVLYFVAAINNAGWAEIGGINVQNGVAYGANGSVPIVFGSASLERMRIDTSGNVLIGRTSASGYTAVGIKLSPTAFSNFTHNTAGSANIGFTAPVSESQLAFYRIDTGALMGSISNGASNTVAYNTSSDYRLKENVQPMVGALSRVMRLKPCTFTWRGDGVAGEGFIAHELQEVVPQAVTGSKDAVGKDGKPAYQGVDASFVVSVLTAALQELKAELDSVKVELQTLKGN